MEHDALLVLAWPVLTALLNLAISILGKSDKPWAQLLARLGTVALSSTKAEKK